MTLNIRRSVRALEGYKTAKQATYAIGVASNENNYGPSPKVMEAMEKLTPNDLLRYPDPLSTKLREAIAMYNGVPADNIVCFSGGDEGIRTVLGLFLDPNSKLLGHAPTFAMYPLGAAFYDAAYEGIPLAQDFSFGEEQKGQFISKLARNPAAIAVCNPNNPTGNKIPKEMLLEIIDAAKQKGVPVIVDEAYFEYHGETVIAKAIEEDGNVIVVRTLSKAFCLAGLRIGYLVAPAPVVEQLLKVKPVFNVTVAAQRAGVAALSDIAWMRGNVAKTIADRNHMTAKIRAMGLNALESHANFILIECAPDFHEKLLAKGVLTRPFALKGWGGGNYCRISVGTSEENEKVLQAVEETI